MKVAQLETIADGNRVVFGFSELNIHWLYHQRRNDKGVGEEETLRLRF